MNRPTGNPRRSLAVFLLGLALAAGSAAAQSLGLPRLDTFGSPIDVGLLVLGHSTSQTGDWPDKLAQSLNQAAGDGRNYVVFRAITAGDGGFLWTQLSFPPGDLQYQRVQASQSGVQWCEDTTSHVRYSCRRAKLSWALNGQNPIPSTSNCRTALAACAPPTTVTCLWHENGVAASQVLPFHDCWAKMDVKLALIQDTSNRSWPVDDANGDGRVDVADFFPAASIPTAAWPCPAGSANPAGVLLSGGTQVIDWNCDNAANAGDAAPGVYARWLERLSLDLLGSFGGNGVSHVFLTQKPLELTNARCGQLFPGEAATGVGCPPHTARTPTASRPYGFFYLPTVYWEHRAIETLFNKPGLDSRIHLATAGNSRAMWNESVRCYENGIASTDWAIPASKGRPASVAADQGENDTNPTGTNGASTTGCLLVDHVHHTEAGGWTMADAWYAGLLPYFQ